MPKIKVLAVEDDERLADTLRMVLDQLVYKLIEVVKQPVDAIRLLKATHPDVVLVGIDWGNGISGIKLVQQINEIQDVPVVYVSSHKEKAAMEKAIGLQPEAYVTRPYEAARLKAAVELAISRKQMEREEVQGIQKQAPPLKAVYVKEGSSLVKLLLQDILLAEAYDKYCFVYSRQKKYLLNTQLKNLVQQLPAQLFMQVHRSFLVNLDAIDKIIPRQNCLEVAGKQVPVSKSYKTALYAHLTTI